MVPAHPGVTCFPAKSSCLPLLHAYQYQMFSQLPAQHFPLSSPQKSPHPSTAWPGQWVTHSMSSMFPKDITSPLPGEQHLQLLLRPAVVAGPHPVPSQSDSTNTMTQDGLKTFSSVQRKSVPGPPPLVIVQFCSDRMDACPTCMGQGSRANTSNIL